MKTCTKCGETKDESLFAKRNDRKCGLRSNCKECDKVRGKKWRDANPEYRKQWYADNPDYNKEYSKKWYESEENRAKKVESNRQFRTDNPEYYRAWDKANPQPKATKLAHHEVEKAIKAGRLERGVCEVCGDTTVHAHHDDYSKPLDVRWLCPVHHKAEHREIHNG